MVAVLPGSKAPGRVSRVKMVPWKWQEQEQFTDPTSAKEDLSQQGLEQRPFPELQRGKDVLAISCNYESHHRVVHMSTCYQDTFDQRAIIKFVVVSSHLCWCVFMSPLVGREAQL